MLINDNNKRKTLVEPNRMIMRPQMRATFVVTESGDQQIKDALRYGGVAELSSPLQGNKRPRCNQDFEIDLAINLYADDNGLLANARDKS